MTAPLVSHVGFCTGTGNGDLSTLERSLARIVELGADCAELSLYGEDLIAGGRIIEGRAGRLAEICAKFDLRYSVHGQIVSNFMDAAHLDLQKAVVGAMIELCERVGADTLVHHGGTAPTGPRTLVADYDRMEREALAEMAELAARRGVRIALENIFAVENGEYRRTPSEAGETVRAVNHPNLVGLIDFSHAYIECSRLGIDWRAEVRAMASATGHLHVHDSFGRPYTMTKFYHPAEATALGIGDLHLPLGWGDIPWEEIFDEIEILPNTMLILEIVERFDSERAESMARARDLQRRINARATAVAAE